MNFFAYHERRPRGTFDFPIEFHYVDGRHPRYQMPLHWHLEYELIFVLEGRFSLQLEDRQFLLEAGDAALVQDGAVHGGVPQNCVYECLVLDLGHFLQESTICQKQAEGILRHTLALTPLLKAGGAQAALVSGLFAAMESEYDGYELVTKGLLLQLIGTMLRDTLYRAAPGAPQGQKRTAQLKSSLALIAQNYAQPLRLEQLAAAAGMSPKYFCRFFKELTGRSPVDYLNYYRMEVAGEKLIAGEAPVTEIALDCGFADLSYFIRTFKKYKGVSPRAFRAGAGRRLTRGKEE